MVHKLNRLPTAPAPSTAPRGISEQDILAELSRTGVRRLPAPFPGSFLYVPKDEKPHPGVVALHGSEGGDAGYTDLDAINLASKGFSVLAFDYYGNSKNLPRVLANVELDRTRAAADWLKKSPYVGGRKIGLFGVSRGAEQALYLASKDGSRRFDAVAAHAPHATVVGSYDYRTGGPVFGKNGCALPAWIDRGKTTREDEPIRIEQFRGPVFISHGTRDRVWGVGETQQLEARLRRAGKRPEVYYFPGEGHVLSPAAMRRHDQLLADFFRRTLR